jgi:hydrogenase 3 maturation protease
LLVAETLDELFADGLDRTLLISLGNSLRSDDGVGPYLAQQLEKIPGVMIENAGDRPERAIDFVSNHRPQKIIFLDAADFGGRPGALRRIETSELAAERSLSSHRLPLAALIDWIEAEYSARCLCLGIQAGSMQLGEELTPAVAETTAQMIEWFEQRLKKRKILRHDFGIDTCQLSDATHR